ASDASGLELASSAKRILSVPRAVARRINHPTLTMDPVATAPGTDTHDSWESRPAPERFGQSMMRIGLVFAFTFVGFASLFGLNRNPVHDTALAQRKPAATALQPNTLCTKDERVIFACALRRPAKIVSICASKNLTRETGYLQYRFGLPAKIELEYPKDRAGTQDKFEYTHYMRALVDLNEIKFSVDGVDYSVEDDYNGEEKPAQSLEGLTISWPNTNQKEVRYTCRTKPKTDYTDLQAILKQDG